MSSERGPAVDGQRSSDLDPQLAERNLEAVQEFLEVLDGAREGAGLTYFKLAYLVGSDEQSVKAALCRDIDITLSDVMMIALALDVRLALGVIIPADADSVAEQQRVIRELSQERRDLNGGQR